MSEELPVQPQPWRVGHRVPEHVYIGDRPLVTMPTATLAALVVAAVNGLDPAQRDWMAMQGRIAEVEAANKALNADYEERFGQCVPVDATWSERVESAAALLLLAGPADLLAALRDAGLCIVSEADAGVLADVRGACERWGNSNRDAEAATFCMDRVTEFALRETRT